MSKLEGATESDREDMLVGLSSSSDPHTISSLLEATLDEQSQLVRRQDSALVYDLVSRTLEGR